MSKRDNGMDKWCRYLGVHSGRCSKDRLQVSYTVWIWMRIWTLWRDVLHQYFGVRGLDSSGYSNVRGEKKMKRITSCIRSNNLEEGNFDNTSLRIPFKATCNWQSYSYVQCFPSVIPIQFNFHIYGSWCHHVHVHLWCVASNFRNNWEVFTETGMNIIPLQAISSS